MSPEQPISPVPKRPDELFGFTEQERLSWRVSAERFKEILADEQTAVHKIEETTNNYGEFLFVTVSRMVAQKRICMTFYGLGFHEYRERWLTDEWFWYQSGKPANLITLTKAEAEDLLKQRREAIAPDVRLDTQSERGRLFEQLADLTDDDAAYAEIEDMGDALDILGLFGDDPE